MVVVGLLLGIVGTDVNTGVQRFTFGVTELSDGIGFIVVAVGVFAIGEIINNLGENERAARLYRQGDQPVSDEGRLPALDRPDPARHRASAPFFGVLPGTGPAIASFASYMLEKKLADDPSRFGNGAIEGVAAPESANNADAQCKFIPMLTLGLPASGVMALMLGAMHIQGIQPGPEVMTQRPDLFWGLIASMWIGNAMLVVLNLPLIGLWVKLLQVPYRLLFPAIMAFSAIGIYSVNSILVRDLPHRAVRRGRLHLHEARLSAGADAARLRARSDDGGEPAPRHADGGRRRLGVRHPSDQPRLHHRDRADPDRDARPGDTQTAGGDYGVDLHFRLTIFPSDPLPSFKVTVS